jgi:hypothetical protein
LPAHDRARAGEDRLSALLGRERARPPPRSFPPIDRE